MNFFILMWFLHFTKWSENDLQMSLMLGDEKTVRIAKGCVEMLHIQ